MWLAWALVCSAAPVWRLRDDERLAEHVRAQFDVDAAVLRSLLDAWGVPYRDEQVRATSLPSLWRLRGLLGRWALGSV